MPTHPTNAFEAMRVPLLGAIVQYYVYNHIGEVLI